MKSKRFLVSILIFCMLFANSCGNKQGNATFNDTEKGLVADSENMSDDLASTDNGERQPLEKQEILGYPSKSAIMPQKENTVMIYMTGSDLESKGGCASKDIMEMIGSGVDSDNTNVVLFTGGCSKWTLDISNKVNTVFYMDNGDFEYATETKENNNMGDPTTLYTFLDYAYYTFPAKHYSLILWDHGGGPVLGYGVDELYGNDTLTLSEMENALYCSPFNGDKLDWVGFDACIMSSIEVCDTFDDYADYLIASQEVEPGAGWDYAFLETYNKTSDPVKIAQSIQKSYTSYYEAYSTYKFDLTLACLDLSETSNTINTVDALFEKMNEDLRKDNYRHIIKARDSMKVFGVTSGKGSAYDIVDLNECAKYLSKNYSTEAQNLEKQIKKLVVSNETTVKNACGVSIYFPFDNLKLYDNWKRIIEGRKLTNAASYNEFLPEFVKTRSGNTVNRSVELQYEKNDDELVINLTDEQLNTLEKATYNVIYKRSDGGYECLSLDNVIEPDDNGDLHVPKSPTLVGIHTGGNNDTVVLAHETSNDDYRKTYYIPNVFLASSIWGWPAYGQSVQVKMTAVWENGSELLEIQNIEMASQDALGDAVDVSSASVGKGTVETKDWEGIQVGRAIVKPHYDDNGKLLPYFEWDRPEEGYTTVTTIDFIEDDLSLVKGSTADIEGEFYCQILLKDYDGNYDASDLYELNSKEPFERIAKKTDKGELTFVVDNGEATLVKYVGNDIKLSIPEKIEGYEVTAIGEAVFVNYINETQTTITTIEIPDSVTRIDRYAFNGLVNLESIRLSKNITEIPVGTFRYCESLKNIDIPDGVERIGKTAFAGNDSLQSIKIPASVTYIGEGAFIHCVKLTNMQVDANNTNYKVIDNILYTKDGKKLVAAPGGAALVTEVVIPEGVEEIYRYAFYGKEPNDSYDSEEFADMGYDMFTIPHLTRVVFPSTLKKIGDCAFFSCAYLESIDLPDSLEHIGSDCFHSYRLLGEAVIDELHIGPNVNKIEHNAFGKYKILAYTVDPKNKRYSAVDGNLMNASGEVIEIEKATVEE